MQGVNWQNDRVEAAYAEASVMSAGCRPPRKSVALAAWLAAVKMAFLSALSTLTQWSIRRRGRDAG